MRATRYIWLCVIWCIASTAHANELPETCDNQLSLLSGALSVAWISPVHQTASQHQWLTVIPTRDLRAWLLQDDPISVAEFLQRTGMRKRSSDPKRRYKVTIFDVTADRLCRPIPLEEPEGQAIAGTAVCPKKQSKPHRSYSECGTTQDFRNDHQGFDVFKAQWRDLALNGFCVLPLHRFVSEGAQ